MKSAYLVAILDKPNGKVKDVVIWDSPEWEQATFLESPTLIAYATSGETFHEACWKMTHAISDASHRCRWLWEIMMSNSNQMHEKPPSNGNRVQPHCEQLDFNPLETSVIVLANGKPSENTGVSTDPRSSFAIACHRYGLDPACASYVALASRKAGSSRTLLIRELESMYGKDWISWACRL